MTHQVHTFDIEVKTLVPNIFAAFEYVSLMNVAKNANVILDKPNMLGRTMLQVGSSVFLGGSRFGFGG